MATNDRSFRSFRIDFFNATCSLHPFLASLLSIGQEPRARVFLTGRVHNADGRHGESASISLAVVSLGAEDGSGNNWLFSGYTGEGQPVKGFIHLSDGNGFVESQG